MELAEVWAVHARQGDTITNESFILYYIIMCQLSYHMIVYRQDCEQYCSVESFKMAVDIIERIKEYMSVCYECRQSTGVP